MQQHIPWPDIKQYREVIRAVKDHFSYVGKDENEDPIYDKSKLLPSIEFTGTVKLHGTNAAIVYLPESGEIYCQSRERVLSFQSDNAGFAAFIGSCGDTIKQCMSSIAITRDAKKSLVLYGEWCGGSIQKGVALNQLSKMFVIFGLKVDEEFVDSQYVTIPIEGIHNISEIPSYSITIDFNRPELSQNDIIKLVEAVEAECPWGRKFGVSGIGEGLVWKPTSPELFCPKFFFKSKGEKHSISKVKTLLPVDVEKANTAAEFVARVVTPQRCEQSISKLRESGIQDITRRELGAYLKWIVSDVIKEESDTAMASGLVFKDISGAISNAARRWFMDNENSL